jgi:myo-inositol 2-dehydrogenase/D-chiro-inositol 1-dehydrogenase
MLSRRTFTTAATSLAAASLLPAFAPAATSRGFRRLRAGVIGCGGRGTGAASDFLTASPETEVVALADLFPERVASAVAGLKGLSSEVADRVTVTKDSQFHGWNAYQQLLAADNIDVVILATPPHFRPMHFEAAVAAGKHVFMEKPVAVDPAGVRKVIAAGKAAAAKNLSVVCGTQRRHERCYLQLMDRLRSGALGDIVSARCYWMQGGLWMHPRKPEWSDMEWQLRNWLYFTWLSGDHIVEQHVHNLDVINWAIGANPIKCTAMGGRQVRTDAAYGNAFDHFAVEYEYPGGVTAHSFSRQIDGCAGRVEEVIEGTKGRATCSSGRAKIDIASGGPGGWRFEGENGNPYVHEHVDLVKSILSGEPINEAQRIAESTLTAIMGRMSAYTGKSVSWDQAMNSTLDLSPTTYAFGPLPTPAIAIPGRTPLA